jgi:hypothetical protein
LAEAYAFRAFLDKVGEANPIVLHLEMRSSSEMRNRLIYSLIITAMGLFVLQSPVKAAQVCKVTDPTDTPLNVRDRPNGEIINALRNGREVDILGSAYDEQGRPWVKIGGYYQGEYRTWGWVIREFISCYNTQS